MTNYEILAHLRERHPPNEQLSVVSLTVPTFPALHLNMDDRKSDKLNAILLEGLRQALAAPSEHRLFKSGKLDGLFPSRMGAAGDAAAEGLRAGYLEVVRAEEKGKIRIDWVRLTPQGVEFIHRHDSPRVVLGEMKAMLHEARLGAPQFLEGMLDQLHSLGKSFAEQMQLYLKRLDALAVRVEEALRRTEAGVPVLSDPLQALIPWGLDALTYLDQRRLGGRGELCPLPELFAVLRVASPQLSIPDFQKGLKRLADNRALRLTPFEMNGNIPEPEFAIPDGPRMLYYASR